MLVVVALWGIPALIQTHGEFFTVGIGRHVVGRSFMTLEGHGASSFGIYRAVIAVLFCHSVHQFLPVVDQVAVANSQIVAKSKGRGQRSRLRRNLIDTYLLSGIAIIFVIFTLVSTKLPHYTLPAFPLLALLLARHWSQGELAAESRRSLFTTIAVATACVWIAVALVVRQWWRGFSPRISSFKCLARLCSRTCNLLRSSSRSQVWSGIFAPAFKVFSRR